MSDPVTNLEIEDVLSSIRRLVSENQEDDPVAKPQTNERLAKPQSLLLTEAQRVEDSHAQPEQPLDEEGERPQRSIELDLKASSAPLDTVPEFLRRRPAKNNDDPIDAGSTVDTAEHPESDMEINWQSSRSSVATELEPDEPGDNDYSGTIVAPLQWEDHIEQDEIVEPAARPEPNFEAQAEKMEAEFAEGTIIETVAEAAADADEQAYEAVLDEEMLRDLVGEIVRQELQGPLGERITRNVRKLVRREINRALTNMSLNADR